MSQIVPFGKIIGIQRDVYNLLNEQLDFIEDNKVFALVRDVVYSIQVYYDDINYTNEMIESLTENNPNLTTEYVYDMMKKTDNKLWYKIFTSVFDYNGTDALFLNKQYSDRKLRLSKYPYARKLSGNSGHSFPRSRDGGVSPEFIMSERRLLWLNHMTHVDTQYDDDYDTEGGDEGIGKIRRIMENGFLKASVTRTDQYPGVYLKPITNPNELNMSEDRYYLKTVHFIFPLYLLKSNAWFGNTKEAYGVLADTTFDSTTYIEHYFNDPQNNADIDEVIFQYDLSIDLAIHIVCPDSAYDVLRPIVGDKLIKASDFVPRKFIDDLFVDNNYDKRKLRLDYSPDGEYRTLLSLKSLYNILLNSGRTEKEAKRMIRTTERNELMLLLHKEFFYNRAHGNTHEVVVHPPW